MLEYVPAQDIVELFVRKERGQITESEFEAQISSYNKAIELSRGTPEQRARALDDIFESALRKGGKKSMEEYFPSPKSRLKDSEKVLTPVSSGQCMELNWKHR